MTRYAIGPDVAVRLARDEAGIRGGHQILAPTLLRSQVLSLLYQAVRRGDMTRQDAERQLDYVRDCGSGCWATASSSTSHGRPPPCSAGPTPLTPITSP